MPSPTPAACLGPDCSATLADRRADARHCSPRCRAAATRLRHREAAAAREEAFRLLLEHGAEIRASLGENRELDRARLDDLAARMDAASLRAEALLGVSDAV